MPDVNCGPAAVSASAIARPHRDDRGFALAETIAALVLLAAAVVLLAQSGSAGWRSIRQADEVERTRQLAQSLLATVGSERPLQPGRLTGRENDGTTWEITIEPHDLATPLPARLRIAAFRIAVSVSQPGESGQPAGGVRLITIKLGTRL
ncbi:MAG: hypothetical protein ACKVP7_24465 [Hyphomicrobiaceae bacterium]